MKIDQQTTLKPNNKNSSCNYDAKRQEYFDNLRKNIEDLQKMLNDLTMKVDGFGTEFNTKEINTVSLSAGDNITTKDLYVNGKATLHGTTEVNDLNVNGSISVVKELIANLLRVTDLYVNNADLNEADINSAIIETLKIKREILRFDTNQEIISFPEEHVTQLGDIANSILLAGLERPTWNGSPLALTSDLSTGLTPNYKGMIDTEDELPPTASIGDFYLIKKVIRKTESGLGSAIYGVSEKWEVTLYYELLNYFNKEEITQLFDDELLDDIQRETDIIKGNTPVQKVANGCVNVAGELLATTDDAFMLSGPEGMDNIKENSSLDELIVCGQYSADDALAITIQDKPEGENGAFDIAVGLFSGDKNNIYQLYTGKETQKLYFRIGLNKAFNGWQEIAYVNGTTPVEVANKLLTHGEIPSFDLPNDYGNKVVQYNGGATNSPGAATNGEAMTFTKTGSQQAIVAFDNTKNDMYYKTQFGDWKDWKQVAVQDSNGYVSKALLAKGLEPNAEMGGKKVATQKYFYEQFNLQRELKTGTWNQLLQVENWNSILFSIEIAIPNQGRTNHIFLINADYQQINVVQLNKTKDDVDTIYPVFLRFDVNNEGVRKLIISIKEDGSSFPIRFLGFSVSPVKRTPEQNYGNYTITNLDGKEEEVNLAYRLEFRATAGPSVNGVPIATVGAKTLNTYNAGIIKEV